MIRMSLALALVLAAALPVLADDAPAPPSDPAAPAAAELEWIGDFDRAVERARAEKKDLLVDFTGSDWCGWCVRLHKEVFAKDAFRAMTKDYVLVALDYPRGAEAKAKVPNPARNAELATTYAVEGYPTVLLMTADGDVFARTGYQPGGAEKYVASLGEMRANGRANLVEAIAASKAFTEAKDDAGRAAASDRAVALLEKARAGDAWSAKLVPAAEAAMEQDAKNAAGRRLRAAKALLRSGTASDSVAAAAREMDPKNEHGALELALQTQFTRVRDEETCRAALKGLEELEATGSVRDVEVAKFLYTNATAWAHYQLKEPERATAYAKKLEPIVDPKDARYAALLKEVLGAKATEEPKPGEPK